MVQISAIWVSQTTHMATIPIPKPLGANPNFCPWLLTIIYDNRDINQGYPKNMLDISQMPKYLLLNQLHMIPHISRCRL